MFVTNLVKLDLFVIIQLIEEKEINCNHQLNVCGQRVTGSDDWVQEIVDIIIKDEKEKEEKRKMSNQDAIIIEKGLMKCFYSKAKKMSFFLLFFLMIE